MDGGPEGQPSCSTQGVSRVDPDLIQFEKPVDRLGVAFSGKIEESSSLIQFFFFGMRGRPPFHSRTPFSIRLSRGMGLCRLNYA